MRRFFVPLLVASCAAALLLGTVVYSAEAPAKKSAHAKTTMSRYLVISPHTAEECLQAMDAISAEGAKTLSKFEFGCMAGDHTAYAIVSASSDEDAMKIVPASLREKARAVKLTKMTAKEIKALHEEKK